MEPQQVIDPALVPTVTECKNALKNNSCSWQRSASNDDQAVVLAYAKHGDIGRFNTTEFHLKGFEDNKLFSWSVQHDAVEVVDTLLTSAIAPHIGADRWRSYMESALENGREDLAVTLLDAQQGVDFINEDICRANLLQLAAHGLCTKFATRLLEGTFGVQVDACSKSYPSSPLQLCTEKKSRTEHFCYSEPYFTTQQRAMVNLLLKHGAKAKFDVTTEYGTGSGWLATTPSKYTQSFVDWCVDKKFDDCLVHLVERKEISGNMPVRSGFGGEKIPLLDWSARIGSLPLMRAIIRPDAKFWWGFGISKDPLVHALNNERKGVIDYLVIHPVMEKRRSTGQLVMRTAVSNGWLDTAHNLVEHHGVSILTGEDDWYKKMALLHSASKNGHIRMMRQLIDWGCAVNEEDEKDSTPLLDAVSGKKKQAVSLLLAAGARARNGAAKSLRGVLDWQYFTDKKKQQYYDQMQVEILDQLLTYDIDYQQMHATWVKEYDKTPLEYVVDTHGVQAYGYAHALLNAGARPNDFMHQAPLMAAVKNGSEQLVSLLLRHGADPEVCEEDGSTLLHFAAARGSSAILEQLRAVGLQDQPNKKGLLPVHYAMSAGHVHIVTKLLDASDEQRHVLLPCKELGELSLLEYDILCRGKNSLELCKLLWDRGIDIGRTNELGQTPVQLAACCGNYAVLEWLVQELVPVGVNNRGQLKLGSLAELNVHEQGNVLSSVLKGLSHATEGAVSINTVFEHIEKFNVNHPTVQITKEQWTQSLAFDPFEQLREWLGDQPVALTALRALQVTIATRGAYLLDTAVKKAAHDNDDLAIKKLLTTGVDMRTVDLGHGATLLHWAAKQGDAEFVKQLLEGRGFKGLINKETRHKCTALSEAKNVECAKILLDHGATITKNALNNVVYSDDVDMCALLLERHNGALKDVDIQVAYAIAVRSGKVKVGILEKLRAAGAFICVGDLVTAVRNGKTEVAAFLLSRGVPLAGANQEVQEDHRDKISCLAHIAVEKKDLALLELVIETANESAINAAVNAGWHEGLKLFLERGILPPHRTDKDILMRAVRAESVECCKLLVEHQVPIVEVKRDHIFAALNATPEIMQLLLQKYPYSTPNKWHAHDWAVLDDLLVKTVENSKADMVKLVLVEHGQLTTREAWQKSSDELLTCVHELAARAGSFGQHERRTSACANGWHERVAGIEWLQNWKKKELEGFEIDVLNKVYEPLEELLATLKALLTTPIFGTAKEHKKRVYQLLRRATDTETNLRGWSGMVDIEKLTAYQVAQRRGTSSTFNDLFDPAKVEQWYGAIDRAYDQQNQGEIATDAQAHTVDQDCGWSDAVAVLLEHFKEMPAQLPRDPLIGSIHSRSVDCCKLLLAHNYVVTWEHVAETVQYGNSEIVQSLLDVYKANQAELCVLDEDVKTLAAIIQSNCRFLNPPEKLMEVLTTYVRERRFALVLDALAQDETEAECLKGVDASLICEVAARGLTELLEKLLVHFNGVPNDLLGDPMLRSIFAHSLGCCQLLVAFECEVTWVHLNNALLQDDIEITEYLLKVFKIEPCHVLSLERHVEQLHSQAETNPEGHTLQRQAMIDMLAAYIKNWNYARRSLAQKLLAGWTALFAE